MHLIHLRSITQYLVPSIITYHFAHYDDFWPKLLMNGEDVDKSEGEHHVVKTQGCTAEPKRFLEHPEIQKPLKHQSCE